jgi:DNA replication protein DnaC
MGTSCNQCGGIGLIRTERGSTPCGCQGVVQARARLGRLGSPTEYAGADLANFEPAPHTRKALLLARRYIEEFVPGQTKTGLMFTGSVGTGKTRLAVSTARALIDTKGLEARFVDVRELLDRLRSSYDDAARETQSQILRPIFSADLVVIDELGAARPTDWIFETIELLIGGLYNRTVPVIVTTNLPNLAAGAQVRNDYERAVRQETLGERIGPRMFSRLQQMTVGVDMTGPDWRAKK